MGEFHFEVYYVDNLNLLIFSFFSFHIAKTLVHELFFQWHEQLKSPNIFWTINMFQIINSSLKRGSNCYRSCVELQHNYWKYVQLRSVSCLYPINMEGPTKKNLIKSIEFLNGPPLLVENFGIILTRHYKVSRNIIIIILSPLSI